MAIPRYHDVEKVLNVIAAYMKSVKDGFKALLQVWMGFEERVLRLGSSRSNSNSAALVRERLVDSVACLAGPAKSVDGLSRISASTHSTFEFRHMYVSSDRFARFARGIVWR